LLYRAKPTGAAPNADGLTLADFYRLPVRDALDFVAGFSAGPNFRKGGPLEVVAGEVRCRLEYLEQVGLGYLSLDRPTRTLSGGETERVNLTTCLGTRLVNTLFVLDEPSVGLHPRDTARLVRILQRLRDAGNTVVVVEHEPEVMRAANHLVDLGPGHGESGGQVVFEGTYDALLRNRASLTGQYLSGTKTIEIERRRPVELDPPRQAQEDGSALRSKPVSHETAIPFRTAATRWLHLSGANHHNLKDLRVSIPLDRFVCVTGVSGSGKSTLVRDVLVPALQARLNGRPEEIKASDRLGDEADDNGLEKENRLGCEEVRIEGGEHLSEVVLVEQTLLGKTPRSTPAVYAGAFDHLRELFADAEPARQRGLAASAFSFNSAQGQCERCRGAGFEKIEMQFLSDVFVRCPDCDGRRYRAQVLEATISPPGKIEHYSIADLLESTIDDAVELLARLESTAAARALEPLRTIQEVGLGYLRLGQPINTLSGGESQRLKLVRYLAATKAVRTAPARGKNRKLTEEVKPILFVFDEPTTGLHFEDIAVLLRVFQRLVDAGHSLLVIEHNLEVIKSADWLIDLGPDAGDQGGQIVGEGTPGTVAAFETHTGKALRQVLRPEHRERKAGRRQSLETSTGRAR
jgi:excinuclease ABC subunit A